jgi:hypothetical protein
VQWLSGHEPGRKSPIPRLAQDREGRPAALRRRRSLPRPLCPGESCSTWTSTPGVLWPQNRFDHRLGIAFEGGIELAQKHDGSGSCDFFAQPEAPEERRVKSPRRNAGEPSGSSALVIASSHPSLGTPVPALRFPVRVTPARARLTIATLRRAPRLLQRAITVSSIPRHLGRVHQDSAFGPLPLELPARGCERSTIEVLVDLSHADSWSAGGEACCRNQLSGRCRTLSRVEPVPRFLGGPARGTRSRTSQCRSHARGTDSRSPRSSAAPTLHRGAIPRAR